MNTRYINTPTLCVCDNALQRTSLSTNRKLLDGSLTYMSKCVSTRSNNKISAFVVSRNYNHNLPNFLLESSTLSSGEKIFFNIRQNSSSLFIFELLSLDTTEISNFLCGRFFSRENVSMKSLLLRAHIQSWIIQRNGRIKRTKEARRDRGWRHRFLAADS